MLFLTHSPNVNKVNFYIEQNKSVSSAFLLLYNPIRQNWWHKECLYFDIPLYFELSGMVKTSTLFRL